MRLSSGIQGSPQDRRTVDSHTSSSALSGKRPPDNCPPNSSGLPTASSRFQARTAPDFVTSSEAVLSSPSTREIIRSPPRVGLGEAKLPTSPEAGRLWSGGRESSEGSRGGEQGRRFSSSTPPASAQPVRSSPEVDVGEYSPYIHFRGLLFIVGDEFLMGLGGASDTCPPFFEQAAGEPHTEEQGSPGNSSVGQWSEVAPSTSERVRRCEESLWGPHRYQKGSSNAQATATENHRCSDQDCEPVCSVQSASIVDAAVRAGFVVCVLRLSAHCASAAVQLLPHTEGEAQVPKDEMKEKAESREETSGVRKRRLSPSSDSRAKDEKRDKKGGVGEGETTSRKEEGQFTRLCVNTEGLVVEERVRNHRAEVDGQGFRPDSPSDGEKRARSRTCPLLMCGSGALAGDPAEELRVGEACQEAAKCGGILFSRPRDLRAERVLPENGEL